MSSPPTQLELYVGPLVPIPVPPEAIKALKDIEVKTTTKGPSVFTLRFKLKRDSVLRTLFLISGGGSVFPIVRVVAAVRFKGKTTVLIDGVITEQKVIPGEGGNDTLQITGEDLSKVMDLLDFSGFPFPGMPLVVRVAALLAKYGGLGVIPLTIPPLFVDVPNPIERIETQQNTDLAYIRELAKKVGHVFYLTPGPTVGTSTAYWGPEIRVGPLQPALTTNSELFTNVKSLSFSVSTTESTLYYTTIQEPISKVNIPIPIPDISLLNPPLGLIPPIPSKLKKLDGIAKANPIQAMMTGLAETKRSNDVITATGTLDVMRYGSILEARKLVGVRGAGLPYNGPYYVESVTSKLERGSFTQSFELKRNQFISSLPRIPV